MLVSIIIPTHGRIKYLQECLRSVQYQTHREFECFIVSDDPAEHLSKKQVVDDLNDSRFIFLEGKNLGANASRNLGLNNSKGEIIFFLDDDDLWLPHKVEKHILYHEASDFVFSDAILRYETKFTVDVYPAPRAQSAFNFSDLKKLQWCPSSSTLVSVSRRIIGQERWDESLPSFQDWDYWVRILSPSSKVAYIPQRLSIFRQHRGDRTSKTENKRLAGIDALAKKYPETFTSDRVVQMRRKFFLSKVLNEATFEGWLSALKLYREIIKERQINFTITEIGKIFYRVSLSSKSKIVFSLSIRVFKGSVDGFVIYDKPPPHVQISSTIVGDVPGCVRI